VSALVLQSVTRTFGATVAVDDVSLELADRELLALLGPSGCGKSTLLRLVAGLHTAEAGTISIGGRIVDDGHHAVPPERRHVGLVFQEHALFPHLTVARNVAFGLRGVAADAVRRRVTEALGLVGLAAHAERYPHELSGGERQRVALARALAPRPALLLLDEPFASLDPNLRAQIRADVVAILRAERIPAVFVTHDQEEALAVGDRIAVLRAGRVEQVDTPERVFHSPANRFVAAFMGEAAFLAGDSADLDLLGTPAAPGAVVMLRPDDVTFADEADGPAEVVAAEFRGSTWCYTLRLPSGASVQSTRSHLRHVAVGTRVRPALVPGHGPVAIPAEPAPAGPDRHR
jgi:iron(III) transport system ATP-binding protein